MKIKEPETIANSLTREICKKCLRDNPIGFKVPDSIWQDVVPDFLQSGVVCISCFTQLADEKFIPWDDQIEFYPVSLHTHLDGVRTTITQLAESGMSAGASIDFANLRDKARDIHQYEIHQAGAILDKRLKALSTVERMQHAADFHDGNKGSELPPGITTSMQAVRFIVSNLAHEFTIQIVREVLQELRPDLLSGIRATTLSNQIKRAVDESVDITVLRRGRGRCATVYRRRP